MRRILLLSFLVAVTHLVCGQHRLQEIRKHLLDETSGVVLVAAHRGVHGEFPENSLDAIREGIRLGVDIVELDVKVSRDGVAFLMHDHTLDRTTTGKGEAEAYTWSELQEFFIIHRGQVTDRKIPSLEDALSLAKDHLMVDLDLKTSEVETVMDVVRKAMASESVFFFDSDTAVLASVHETSEFLVMPRARSRDGAKVLIDRFAPEVVHIDPSFYNRKTTRLIASHGARVWINALGEADRLLQSGKSRKIVRKLTAKGANIIQTDHPDLLLKALERQGLRSE